MSNYLLISQGCCGMCPLALFVFPVFTAAMKLLRLLGLFFIMLATLVNLDQVGLQWRRAGFVSPRKRALL